MYHSRGQQHELALGELRVDQGEGQHVEGQVPRGVPGILPLVRHGDDVGVVEVLPVAVAAVTVAAPAAARLGGVALEPLRHVVVVELLAPDHAGERLALHGAGVGVRDAALEVGVERVGLRLALGDQAVEAPERVRL